MNIINATKLKTKALGVLDTKQNILYQGEQSGKFYLGLRTTNVDETCYLDELSSGKLLWQNTCQEDSTFVAVEADVVIKA